MAGSGSTSSASWTSSNGSAGRTVWASLGARGSSGAAAVPGPSQRTTPAPRSADGATRSRVRARSSGSSSKRARERFDARPGRREVRGRRARRDRRPLRERPHAHARQQAVRRGPECGAPRVALERAILARARRRARQRRARQPDGVGPQRVAQQRPRPPPHRRHRQQRRAQQEAGQGAIHARRVTHVADDWRETAPV